MCLGQEARRERRRRGGAAPRGGVVREEDEREPGRGKGDVADVVGLVALRCLHAFSAHETSVGAEGTPECLFFGGGGEWLGWVGFGFGFRKDCLPDRPM